jgi:DNA-binding MarR family transcriptional regulator
MFMKQPEDLPGPSTERQRLVIEADLALLELAARLRQHWSNHAAAVGLSTAQVKVLLLMKPGQAVPMRILATQLDYDASNFSTMVDRLEHRGVVERRADPGDRRVKALALTPEGERQRAVFWSGLLADPGPLGPLSEENLADLVSLFGKLEASGEPREASALHGR